jgi:hypothetical protein
VRVVAALALGAATPAEVRAATGLDARRAHRALERLVAAGVVRHSGDDADRAGGVGRGRFELLLDGLVLAARAVATREPRAGRDDGAPQATPEEKVRRTFLRDGRLTRIPTQRSKRLVILDFLAQEFEPGHRYPEREVNRRLRAYHEDVASLRRYLVDEGFLEREGGEYWRAGGSFRIE